MGSTIPSRESDQSSHAGYAAATALLSRDVLDSIIVESEAVLGAFASPRGLSRIDDDGERHVDLTVVVVLTDERVYFVSGADGDGASTEAGSLRYDELASVTVEADLALSTVAGVTWRLPLDDGDEETVDAAVRHLRWIGDVRSRLVATANDVDLAVGRIREAAADVDWERGTAAYERRRTAMDELVDAVLRTEPVDVDALAPELTELERRLERAYAELLIERSRSRLTLRQQLRQSGDHERARVVTENAVADYEAARGHAETVQRADAFMFGEQRELRARLEHLDREMQAVAAEPLRQATEAKLQALSTTDPGEAVRHWEAAFENFEAVLALADGSADEESVVAGDTEDVREELADAAGQLIGIHRTLSRTLWDQGTDGVEAGDGPDADLEPLEAAIGHVERAREIAADARPDAVPEMDDRLETLRDELERYREESSSGETPGDSAETEDDGDANPDDASLTSLDTHHDIQIEGSVGDVGVDDADGEDLDSSGIVLPDLDDGE